MEQLELDLSFIQANKDACDANSIKKGINECLKNEPDYSELISVEQRKSYISIKAKSFNVATITPKSTCIEIAFKSKYEEVFARHISEDKFERFIQNFSDYTKVRVSSFDDVMALIEPLSVISLDVRQTLCNGVHV